MPKKREVRTFGAIEIGWGTSVVLPLDQAAELLDLISEGLVCRMYVSGEGEAYCEYDESGKAPRPPSLEVLTHYQRYERLERGREERRRRKAAAEAEASNVTELKQPAE